MNAYLKWIFIVHLAFPNIALSQSNVERFQDLFSTAGYASAFGATLGAAALSFQPNPERNLRFIAIGASLGFIGGSVLGSYIIFSPVFTSTPTRDLNPISPIPTYRKVSAVFSPSINTKTGRLNNINANFSLVRF